MTDTPERIFGWMDTQLSIARLYGGIKYNGNEYVIATHEEGNRSKRGRLERIVRGHPHGTKPNPT